MAGFNPASPHRVRLFKKDGWWWISFLGEKQPFFTWNAAAEYLIREAS